MAFQQDFKRLLSHEYIESKLMEQGYHFRSLDEAFILSPYNAGAHELSPLIGRSGYSSSLERVNNPPLPNNDLSNLNEIFNFLISIYKIQ